MDEFIDNPLYLAGGGGVLALLGGYAAYAVRRKRKVEKFENSIITGGDLKANSVFGNTGGQNVDTGNSSFQSDFSQVSTGSIDADEVDPVAEADVYMAYGRDAQAEEILKEALAKDASRHAVRVKLMEIYSQRSDTASFESHAKELHAATGGQGDHWNRAAELGRALLPGNPLFGSGEAAPVDSMTSTVALGAGTLAAVAAAAEAPDASMESTMQMAAFPATQAPASPESRSKTLSLAPVQQTPASMDVDFDLGGATPAETPSAGAAPDFDFDAPATEAAGDAGASLDFDIGGGDGDATMIATAPAAAAAPAIDFAPGGTVIMGAGDASPEPAVDHSLDETQELADSRLPDLPSPTIDFDFDLSADTPASASAPAVAAAPAGNSMDFDLSGIDLDLPTSGASAPGDAPSDDASTKLDLAKAYQDMGDKEGAKELLQEVLKEGNDAQKSEAKTLLSSIG
jgi:pilus assembly protein FimV